MLTTKKNAQSSSTRQFHAKEHLRLRVFSAVVADLCVFADLCAVDACEVVRETGARDAHECGGDAPAGICDVGGRVVGSCADADDIVLEARECEGEADEHDSGAHVGVVDERVGGVDVLVLCVASKLAMSNFSVSE